VLGLPNAVAWLGWVGGVAAVLLFYAISVWLGILLSEVYHAKGNARFPTYKAAVRGILGKRHLVVLATAQTTYQVGLLC
jgi:amino acid permease